MMRTVPLEESAVSARSTLTRPTRMTRIAKSPAEAPCRLALDVFPGCVESLPTRPETPSFELKFYLPEALL